MKVGISRKFVFIGYRANVRRAMGAPFFMFMTKKSYLFVDITMIMESAKRERGVFISILNLNTIMGRIIIPHLMGFRMLMESILSHVLTTSVDFATKDKIVDNSRSINFKIITSNIKDNKFARIILQASVLSVLIVNKSI